MGCPGAPPAHRHRPRAARSPARRDGESALADPRRYLASAGPASGGPVHRLPHQSFPGGQGLDRLDGTGPNRRNRPGGLCPPPGGLRGGRHRHGRMGHPHRRRGPGRHARGPGIATDAAGRGGHLPGHRGDHHLPGGSGQPPPGGPREDPPPAGAPGCRGGAGGPTGGQVAAQRRPVASAAPPPRGVRGPRSWFPPTGYHQWRRGCFRPDPRRRSTGGHARLPPLPSADLGGHGPRWAGPPARRAVAQRAHLGHVPGRAPRAGAAAGIGAGGSVGESELMATGPQEAAQPVRVWAPYAHEVQLVVDGRVHPMRRDGQWWIRNEPLAHGQDYGFVLDGQGPFPDPRSPWQPRGVHELSRHFDPGLFPFTDTDWAGRDVRESVLYELHVGTFTAAGTLRAAIAHLPDLVDLGVTMVELMPVAAFEGSRGWGYDGVSLYAVHEAYGGPRALQEFVDAAHAQGLAVCLDVDYNHRRPSGNYLPRFGPYFTADHQTPWGAALNLDGPDSHPVRQFILDNASRWFTAFHIDALRLDAVHALVDESGTHLLAELSQQVGKLAEEEGRPLSLIAESDQNDPAAVTPAAEGGLGMTAQWDDDVHHAIHAFLTGERHGYYTDFGSAQALAKAMTEVFVHNGTYSSFRDRIWGRPVPVGMDGRRFVVTTENHDQVGNRGIGDRPAHTLDEDHLALGTALLLCGPYT